MRFEARQGSVALRRVKRPAVAGQFYPGDAESLGREVDALLRSARGSQSAPKALIAPHAGYRYSGAIAASAYARLRGNNGRVRRVVLLGPTHYLHVAGIAVCSAEVFATPLGDLPVDTEWIARALELPFVARVDAAFDREHSLEVHLPFLLRVLGNVRIVPLLVGDAAPAQVSRLIEALWGGPETAIVVSSDLSHYQDYETAKRMDSATSKAIEELRFEAIGSQDACGRHAVNGLLHFARARGLRASTIDLRNSGDTAGTKDRVVGYGAYLFHEQESGRLSFTDRRRLLGIAANSIRHGLDGGGPKPVTPADYSPPLREKRACFVTLKLGGKLRGCIGSVSATRTLVEDVAHNAHGAAFNDPRFSPVEEQVLERLEIGISVLSPTTPMMFDSEAALIAQLRLGIDGLILEEGAQRGTYLPSVWESLPDPRRFVAELKRKAGWDPNYWSDGIRAFRYTTESFS